MARAALVVAVFALWGLMSGLCADGHVWHRADIEPTYTPDQSGWRQGESEHNVEIASSWPKPTEERVSTSLDQPDPVQYIRAPTRPLVMQKHRHGPVTDKSVVTRFIDKLQRSLERSTNFNSRPDYHACMLPTGSKGCCTPVRLCVLPVFLDSLDVFLKYTCAIDNDHIGVCCPTEFVVNTNIPRRPDGTFVIATVLSPSPPRPTKNTTVHVVVTTSSSRPVYPVQHDEDVYPHNGGGHGTDNRHVSSTGSSGNRPGNRPSDNRPGIRPSGSRPQGGSGTTTTTQRSTTSRPAVKPSPDPHSHMKRNPPRPRPPELQEIRSTCGIPALHKRIIGGNEAEPNKWAWMAALLRRETGEHYCGGALISNRYVITAAHCTEGLKAQNITVRLGAYNIQDPTGDVRDIEVSRIRQHPDFQKDTFKNDISVLRLKRPVTFNEYIRPVCLPERSEDTYFGKTAVATGWGTQTFGGPYSDILREVKLIVWNNTDCNQRFAQPITEVFLCAGAKKREGDACQGDSGGPLMVQTRTKQWTLIGVISWGIKCGEPGVPGIYTRISHFLDYIYEHAVNQ